MASSICVTLGSCGYDSGFEKFTVTWESVDNDGNASNGTHSFDPGTLAAVVNVGAVNAAKAAHNSEHGQSFNALTPYYLMGSAI